ncbi:MAG TPA: HPr family phosphocarrier protein [Candidatus Caccovicinus merdipullorum]|uniref:HPr family phosphocarrier protein n=1 Tax=Candidatus Caccovicinus merdipullorum TaxID=2840724 RepID=A0A9D1GJ40_9FIRM|nr:HPr family phosphocarrier protein [Candidatus Cottocaccamicrobium excrementipullorum]HIT41708.1 HPr family phosphocarrier protein [Candidatus Caccovicinus merdipullorum]
MVSKTLTVVNPSGLHLRPAGVLSQTAMKFKCDVIIECGEKRIVAKSVLNVMAAGIKCGTEITLICDGEDENEALATITKAIEDGLGEK